MNTATGRATSLRRLTTSTMAGALVLGLASTQSMADDVDYAKKVVSAALSSKMSKAPLDVGGVRWSGADSSPPPIKGVSVAVMPCPLSYDVCKYLYNSAAAAAQAIGWEPFSIDNKGDPAVAQQGVDAAINRGAKCVLTLASPARDIKAQITRGEEKGVAFVTGFSDDPKPFGGNVGYGLDYAAAGAILGAYVIAHGGGGVVVFNASQDPQLTVRINGFKSFIEKYGGTSAKIIHEEDFSLAQGGQGEITKMQAILTRFPKDSFKWVIAPFDETLTPLLQTAQQRGRDEIQGVSFDGEEVAYADIRKGGPQVASVSWGLEWVAWAGIDECNRALNKAEVGVNKDFPLQLTEASNVPPKDQRYDTGFDFKSHYIDMWKKAAGAN